jgi:GNAT superfamily N-acetyltransferase
MRLSTAAGWNQTEADWTRVMRLAPEGCFGIDADGRLAATATLVCYGADLAWIGMVLTDPELRGRGYARRLMEHAIARAPVSWIKLDATDMGRPLYLKLGFTDECPIERWELAEAPARPDAPLEAQASDEAAIGAGRGALFAILEREGHLLGRPGRKAAYFGPCASAGVHVARSRLCRFLNQNQGKPVYWDLLPENRGALELAGEFGFKPVRRLMRMARRGGGVPKPPAGDRSLIYAIAGFEYG